MSDFNSMMTDLEERHEVWLHGFDQGYASGRNDRLEDDTAAAIHREAARVAALVMDAPERDPEAGKTAAQRRADAFGQPLMKAVSA